MIPAEQEGGLGDDEGVPLEESDQEARLMSDEGEGRESVGTKCYREFVSYTLESIVAVSLELLLSPGAVRVRVVVIRQIWRLLVAVTASYLITLLVFPGIISEVQFSPLKDWMPILLITIFNFFDLVAKVCTMLQLCAVLLARVLSPFVYPVACSDSHPLVTNWPHARLSDACSISPPHCALCQSFALQSGIPPRCSGVVFSVHHVTGYH